MDNVARVRLIYNGLRDDNSQPTPQALRDFLELATGNTSGSDDDLAGLFLEQMGAVTRRTVRAFAERSKRSEVAADVQAASDAANAQLPPEIPGG